MAKIEIHNNKINIRLKRVFVRYILHWNKQKTPKKFLTRSGDSEWVMVV